MKKILLRGDDLGYSEAVNYGIEKSIKKGLIESQGVMVNMPATQHGVDLVKDCDIAFSVHVNISNGRPLTDIKRIPSLVDENGYFKSSKTYRNSKEDFVNFDEVVLEIEAQYQKFIELFGRKPDYFEGHAVASANFFKGLKYVADKYSLKYSGLSSDGKPIIVGQSKVLIHMESMKDNYDPLSMIQSIVENAEEDIVQIIVFHPGYLDEDILISSSLTFSRVKEVSVLTDPTLKNWLMKKDVVLLNYRDL